MSNSNNSFGGIEAYVPDDAVQPLGTPASDPDAQTADGIYTAFSPQVRPSELYNNRTQKINLGRIEDDHASYRDSSIDIPRLIGIIVMGIMLLAGIYILIAIINPIMNDMVNMTMFTP